MTEITDNLVASVAREMAIAIRPASEILESHGLTQEQFESDVQPLAFYKQSYHAFIAEWNSIGNTNRRLAMQAGTALEIVLPLLAARVANRAEQLGDVTKTAELFSKIAGIDADKKGSPGEKIKITINLGADTRVFEEKVIDSTPAPALEKPSEPA